ncbi:MAG: hypothetical protein JO120_10210 [Solirubrobacterales bacterium]|nr:hypothetical protein [Solirubrobacterales bacterium]
MPVEGLSLSTGASLAVAVGTLLLAAFTAFLAYETRRVAGDTEEDVTAQWRPVLIAVGTSVSVERSPGDSDGEVSFTLVNTGQGPAINTTVTLKSESSVDKRESPESAWGTLAVGQEHNDTVPKMLFRDSSGGQQPFLRYTVIARYTDLADRVHTTILTCVDPATGTRSASPGEKLVFEVRIADTRVLGPPRPARVRWRLFKRVRRSG